MVACRRTTPRRHGESGALAHGRRRAQGMGRRHGPRDRPSVVEWPVRAARRPAARRVAELVGTGPV